MDRTTVAGTLFGFGLVLCAMALGEGGIASFIDVPALFLVLGGTTAVALMSFPGTDLRGLVKVLLRSYVSRPRSPAEAIDRILELAALARREGVLGLETKLREIDDGFFSKGLQLVVDGVPAGTVRDIMSLEAEWQRTRHVHGKKMLDLMGSLAPAFGMVGTLVGLVQMLQSLSDPAQIGAGLAGALLALLYGALVANLLLLPLAAKLEVHANEEALLRRLMVEGLVCIQEGENAQLIKERLKAFLAPQAREAVAA